ncbi:unnamed protein product [Pleuronectes platessa]|uniref:Uncharacterized protein n=1 Tax=Pleuronectes platessa TaxID=8262 RepID=A0A9N7V3U8_PLEPL|nr:unnamed protein product [Pleuronectes platessa]
MTTLLLASALLTGLLGLSAAAPAPPAPAPFHAFCKTQWFFVTPCTDISSTIVEQIQAFSPKPGCDVCRYKLVSVSPQSVTANHTSAVAAQSEDLLFAFSPLMSGGCRVAVRI